MPSDCQIPNAERITNAIAQMRDRLQALAGESVESISVDSDSTYDDNGNPRVRVTLRARLTGLDAKTRADVAEALLDYLADHPNKDVREHVSLRIQ